MLVTIEKVTQEALALCDHERAQLAHTLLLSLDAVDNAADSEAAWDVEIRRRLEGIKSGADGGRPAEEVFQEIRAHYQ